MLTSSIRSGAFEIIAKTIYLLKLPIPQRISHLENSIM